jgi:hypothetical protein
LIEEQIGSAMADAAKPGKFPEAVFGKLNLGHKIGEPSLLFPRKDV